MKIFNTVLLLICFLLPVNAEELLVNTREQNIDKIIEAQGLKEIWKEQVESAKTSALMENQAVIEDMIAGFGASLNEKQQACVRDLFDKTAMTQLNSFVTSADEMLRIWKKYYAVSLSDKEVEALAAFYSSDLARKETESNKTAMIKFSNELSSIRLAKSGEMANTLIEEVGKAFESSNCSELEDKKGTEDL